MPSPDSRASVRSRARRVRTFRRPHQLRRGTCSSSRLGSQRRPSRISTVVTASTDSCVSARSGAENHAKVTTVTRPDTLISAKAVSRWYLACQTAPSEAPMPTSHSSANMGEKVSGGRVPVLTTGPRPCSHKVAVALPTVTPTSKSSCGCRRRVPNRRSARRLRAVSQASTSWKICLLRIWLSSGVRCRCPPCMGPRSSA